MRLGASLGSVLGGFLPLGNAGRVRWKLETCTKPFFVLDRFGPFPMGQAVLYWRNVFFSGMKFGWRIYVGFMWWWWIVLIIFILKSSTLSLHIRCPKFRCAWFLVWRTQLLLNWFCISIGSSHQERARKHRADLNPLAPRLSRLHSWRQLLLAYVPQLGSHFEPDRVGTPTSLWWASDKGWAFPESEGLK